MTGKAPATRLRRLAGEFAGRRSALPSHTRALAWALVVAVGGSVAFGASGALAAAPVPANPGGARLTGQFLLAGHVTGAMGVAGVHAGQNVLRTWTFTPGCAAGACDTVKLVRLRTGGSDTILLRRLAPAYYGGAGSFYVPLRCGRRNYARGQLVPFRIRVRVSGAVLSAGAVYATRLEASYTNPSRTNLTRCVTAAAHVTATYQGHLVTLAAGGAATRRARGRGGV